MQLTRRSFLRICFANAAALGLSAADLGALSRVLAADAPTPPFVWIVASGCTGCSVSFLNHVAADAPRTAAEVLTDSVPLVFHPLLLTAAGEAAAARAVASRDHVLIVEGSVPTAFGGNCCTVWTHGGREHTAEFAIRALAATARHVVCVGACASFGGIQAAPPNPTGAKSVREFLGRPTINVAGCPPHPEWMVWTITRLLLGREIELDDDGRPAELFGTSVHRACARRRLPRSTAWGQDHTCARDIGCRGPQAQGKCPTQKWNNGANWCVDANAACINCTGPGFPYSPVIGRS